MKKQYVLIFVLALGLMIAAILSLTDDLVSPYVSFPEAMEREGEFVQVIGTYDPGRPVQHEEGFFTFFMKDSEGNNLHVKHEGVKPLNFEHAEQVVVLGRYDSESKIFRAEKLLVKCPSKYEKEGDTSP
jgi:cytochrome c-type biogenesis protein CcmE